MKTEFLGLIACIILVGCEKKCDDLEDAARADYLKALSYTGGSQAAVQEITRQYNEKLSKIQKDCR